MRLTRGEKFPLSNRREDPIMEDEQVIATLGIVLWGLAWTKKDIHFNELLKILRRRFGTDIAHDKFTDLLQIINQRTWKLHRCLLTVIVFGKERRPGAGFFPQAKELGAISSYSSSKSSLRDITNRLRNDVYEVAETEIFEINY